MHARAVLFARANEFPCVVAGRAADDDDNISRFGECYRCGLALLSWLANCVGKPDIGIGKALANALHQGAHSFDGLRRLRRDANALVWSKGSHVFFGQHHIKVAEVFGDAPDFDMISLSDDDRMVPVSDEIRHSSMGGVDEWASGFGNLKAMLARPLESFLRGAMGCDHSMVSFHRFRRVDEADALLAEFREHSFVMDQITEDGEGPMSGLVEGESDGVTDTEAHTEMLSANYLHNKMGTKEAAIAFVIQSINAAPSRLWVSLIIELSFLSP